MKYLRFNTLKREHAEKQPQPVEVNPPEVVVTEKPTPPAEPVASETTIAIDEMQLSEATRIVVRETMKVLQPLLDKLGEAVEQQKQEAAAKQASATEDPLAKMKEAASERVKLQEQKIAQRVNQIQSRIAKGK